MREKLEKLSITDLRVLAKEKGLKKVSTLKKAQLIEVLLKAEEENNLETENKTKKTEEVKEEKVNILVRGLRALSDYEYELQFTLTNKTLAKSDFETIFLSASREYLYLSSSLVKEIAQNKGDLKMFVPKNVEKRMIEKVKQMKI